jgi:hypothetical protein
LKRLLVVLQAGVLLVPLAFADDAGFGRVRLADPKGRQTNATLTFHDENKSVVVRVADKELAVIPYADVDRFTYEYTKKHRVTQGAIVMLASVGAGAIVMLTKSRSHWLEIDYREKDVAKSVVLRMDKREYRSILDAVKAHTGKDVEMLGNANKSKKS